MTLLNITKTKTNRYQVKLKRTQRTGKVATYNRTVDTLIQAQKTRIDALDYFERHDVFPKNDKPHRSVSRVREGWQATVSYKEREYSRTFNRKKDAEAWKNEVMDYVTLLDELPRVNPLDF